MRHVLAAILLRNHAPRRSQENDTTRNTVENCVSQEKETRCIEIRVILLVFAGDNLSTMQLIIIFWPPN